MENNENRSNLQKFFGVVLEKLVYILAIGAAAAMVAALITVFLIPPKYSSVAKFYVNNNKASSSQSEVSQQDINASQSLAETSIVYIRNSGKLIQAVIDEADSDLTVAQVKKMITTGTYSGTEFFYVSVSASTPEEALTLAKAFDKVIPEKIPETVMGAVLKSADDPRLPVDQDSPNLAVNAVIGAVLGIVVAIVIFFLRVALDNTVYTEEDLEDIAEHPVIGVIPTIAGTADTAAKKKRKEEA